MSWSGLLVLWLIGYYGLKYSQYLEDQKEYRKVTRQQIECISNIMLIYFIAMSSLLILKFIKYGLMVI